MNRVVNDPILPQRANGAMPDGEDPVRARIDAEIEAGLDELDAGRSVPWERVRKELGFE